MPHSLSQLYVHLVFHVGTHCPRINKSDLAAMYAYMKGILTNLGCVSIAIGGMPDHVHLFFLLSREHGVAHLVQHLKTASARYLKAISPYYSAFKWQRGYGIFSVSAAVKDNVVNYIAHQEMHHQHKTMQEEYEEMLDVLGISYDREHLWE